MKIAVLKEKSAPEKRVALTPETVRRLVDQGAEVSAEAGAGDRSGFTDAQYEAAGASVAKSASAALEGASVLVKVAPPEAEEIASYPEKLTLIAPMRASENKALLEALAARSVETYALEKLPRISRAQAMDVLSSQSNLAGYAAVIKAAELCGRAFPMMTTAAGTVPPARVLVLGAGVAGLQAIATAKRLGAVVYAFDVRAAAKEQVESLGGKFVVVDGEAMKAAETKDGYAREMSEEYKRKQAEALSAELAKADVVVCTALIPGKKAPVLITEDMLSGMKRGAVVMDLAVANGGNCAGAKEGLTETEEGVRIVGEPAAQNTVAANASALFARNVYNFLMLGYKAAEKTLAFDPEDEIIKATAVVSGGRVQNV